MVYVLGWNSESIYYTINICENLTQKTLITTNMIKYRLKI